MVAKPIATEHEVEQGTDEWLELRAGLITASNFDKVMMSPTTIGYREYLTTVALERIHGRPFESYRNKDMERGNELEPIARMLFTLKEKQEVKPSGIFLHNELPVAASLDGKIGDDGIWENKAPRRHNHSFTLKKGEVPSEYRAQVQGQLWITGRTYTKFTSFSDEFPTNAQFAVVHVERDEPFIELLQAKILDFIKAVDQEIKFILEYK